MSAKSSSTKSSSTKISNHQQRGSAPIGIILIVSAIALSILITLVGLDQRYWILPPHQKFEQSWKKDLNLLRTTKQAELLKRVAKIRVRSDGHSPVDQWMEKINPPIELNKDGDLLGDVFIIHQIDENRYGVTIQYEFIQLKDQNKIGEFARTLWLGVYY